MSILKNRQAYVARAAYSYLEATPDYWSSGALVSKHTDHAYVAVMRALDALVREGLACKRRRGNFVSYRLA